MKNTCHSFRVQVARRSDFMTKEVRKWFPGLLGLLFFVPAAFGDGALVPLKPVLEKAAFAGGCFWCMQPPFEKLDGVVEVLAGYTGGKKANPTYKEVSEGETGHAESVEVTFDPGKVSYEKLLDVFWHNIDPTTVNREFVDVGDQYRTAIFYHSDRQKQLAEASKEKLEKEGRFHAKIVTEITKSSTFYPAEDYHQDYYKKNPLRYRFYRLNSGRDQYLDKIWGAARERH